MTDYKEEQKNEIEALESIYPNELEILSCDPYHIFTIKIKTESLEESEFEIFVTLKFTYVPNYPDEVPLIEIIEYDNIEDEDVDSLSDYLLSQAEENLGMVMIFTLVSVTLDWLNNKADYLHQQKKEQEERRLKQLEEEERKKFEGTRVTVETFLTWKTKFDAEMAEIKRNQFVKEELGTKKLTGRELFEKDRTLIESDLRFLQEGDEEVKVDESLFQELDDLELEDDFDENENTKS
ncbi:RWD domain-containing protein 1-like [Centruroides sculpturatus]|uniref:RWD domain-containing protein 1-like n=1 Tax=Centruroides sculpturatus TaxID=218467 RepID=UPI000C6E1111|nr:RWD domain-containing protein 1-like [Centruroides sculpturatus]